MKKIILILLMGCFTFTFGQAQDGNNPNKAEKIEALKIAFITQKLQLTSEEAKNFWPVYGQYENEIRQTMGHNNNGDALDNEEKVLNIRKRYRSQFVKVLGQPRMNQLFNAEKDFRGALIRHLKNRPMMQQRLNRRR
ncbi:MAG: hypothetical protein H0W12_10550 [Chitinophagaceae bacterium]|nr:hypothetical protein [Chitinophagaceae bacterium]